MLSIKNLFDSEASARLTNEGVLKNLIKELMKDDNSKESKQFIYEEICKMIMAEDSWEDSNSHYWFKMGKYCGVPIGMAAAGGAYAIGVIIGKIIVSKIES